MDITAEISDKGIFRMPAMKTYNKPPVQKNRMNSKFLPVFQENRSHI
jgi:hypothetical protein